MLETTTTTAATPAGVPTINAEPKKQETDPRITSALVRLRAAITTLDDESITVFDWQYRDEVIANLREAVDELRRL